MIAALLACTREALMDLAQMFTTVALLSVYIAISVGLRASPLTVFAANTVQLMMTGVVLVILAHQYSLL